MNYPILVALLWLHADIISTVDYSQMVGLYQDPQGDAILTQHAQQRQEKQLDSLPTNDNKDEIDLLKKRIIEIENLLVQQVCLINH